jgi:hypothetical protein
MATITESFLTRVQDAICDEVLRLCGAGPEAYPDPDYLQIQTARRGHVAQGFDVTKAELPAFVIEYIYSDETGPGGQTAGGDYTHVFNAAVLLELTGDSIGLLTEDRQEFRTAVEASADVMTRRVHRALRAFAPDVLDEGYGESSANVKVGIFRYVLREQGQFAFAVQILFELLLTTEDLTM